MIRNRPSRSYTVFAVCIAGLIGIACLRSCATQHSRPRGHGDVTFDISPNGQLIVFNAIGSGGRDLYLLDVVTNSVRRIAETPHYEVDPSFSPDGKAIVYAAGKRGDRADHIFIRSVDNSDVRQLTFEDASKRAFQPSLTHGLPWEGIDSSAKESSHGTQAESINGSSVA